MSLTDTEHTRLIQANPGSLEVGTILALRVSRPRKVCSSVGFWDLCFPAQSQPMARVNKKGHSMKHFLSLTLSVLALGLVVLPSQAQVTVSTGAGSAITGSPDRIATFSSVVGGMNLNAYTENGLSITVSGTAFTAFDPTHGSGLGGFSGGFFYPGGGANGATIIKATDSSKIFGVEFNVGDGFPSSPTHFAYFAFNGVTQIATGAFDVTSGTVLGFSAPSGIDALEIGAYTSLPSAQAAGPNSFQAAAIDNLKVNVHGATSAVPEPSAYALLGSLGLTGAAFLRRRRAR